MMPIVSPRDARSRPLAGPTAVIDLLREWLARSVTVQALQWLDQEIERQRKNVDDRGLGIALGLVRRKLGANRLSLDAGDIASAGRARAHWQPELWGSDEAARVAILLATHHDDNGRFAARVDRLCATGEITEQIALLKGFAVFPAAAELHGRAREGVRSSIQAVFEAIACHNPYPFDHFDMPAWNQMVVKCVFSGASIDAVVGLRERRNPELVRMLRDFVAERHAAGRPLPKAVHDYLADD
jgi:hypothetical protein